MSLCWKDSNSTMVALPKPPLLFLHSWPLLWSFPITLSPFVFPSSLLFPELFRDMALPGLLLTQHQVLAPSHLPHVHRSILVVEPSSSCTPFTFPALSIMSISLLTTIPPFGGWSFHLPCAKGLNLMKRQVVAFASKGIPWGGNHAWCLRHPGGS